ncbi:hypothetical protein QR680_017077 [Steinernema hermaphroditum]|uniref:UBC core domain-containing protein n=1 Tax=Steinernema hermaphroditum TaxID=289476 RepID=A0AA39HD81_9BILA|nr:hypothetical protein QR680_017077 [Steinernema hermaphroditum]
MTSTAPPAPERHGGDLSLAQVKAVGQKRLLAELAKLSASKPKGLLSVAADPKDVYIWNLVIAPNMEPYKGFFKIRLNIHPEYPFKPPKIFFDTPIYHMNVDPNTNQACLHALQADAWQPSTQMDQVLRSLFHFLSYPQPERAVQPQLSALFLKNQAGYLKAAADFTKEKASEKLA